MQQTNFDKKINKETFELIECVFDKLYSNDFIIEKENLDRKLNTQEITYEEYERKIRLIERKLIGENIELIGSSLEELQSMNTDTIKSIFYLMQESLQNGNKKVYSEALKNEFNINKANFFLKKFSQKKINRVSTGFKKLDQAISGGLGSGLCVLGALSSLGKTSLAVQMADNIAEAGNKVIFYTREQPVEDLIAKSICRISGLTFSNLENINGKKEQINQNIIKAWQKYKPIAKNLITKEINYKWNQTILNDIKSIKAVNNNNPPIIFIDYLQLLPPLSDQAMTDKQRTDQAVDTLKQIIRQENCTIFIISSLNRTSYNSPVELTSFKESGSIEYTAELVIGMQPHRKAEDEKGECIYDERKGYNADKVRQWKYLENKDIELTILKNRNGRTGQKVNLEFQSRTFKFVEK